MLIFVVRKRLLSFIYLCFLLTVVGLPSARAQSFMENAKKALLETVTAKVGEAVGADAPLHLNHKSAFHAVDPPIDFHPKVLRSRSASSVNRPLAPGDYTFSVIGYCTALGIPSPGNGLGQKIAPLQGKDADIVATLINRGTATGVPIHTLQTMVWRIEDRLPIDKWPSEDQRLINQLIPSYKKRLSTDTLENIQKTYNASAKFLKMPPFDTLLSNMGEPGRGMLKLREARKLLANKAIANERLPQLLFEQAGSPILPSSSVEASSEWSEIRPGIIARFVTLGGAGSENHLDFRILPSAVQNVKNLRVTSRLGRSSEGNSGFQLTRFTSQGQDTTAPIQWYPSIQSILTGSELVAGEIIEVAGETFVVATETVAIAELLPVEIVAGTVYIVYSIGQHATQPLIMAAPPATGSDRETPYADDIPSKSGNEGKYRGIKGTPAKVNTEDGSVWEPDTAGHGGSNGKDGLVKDLGESVILLRVFGVTEV